MQNLVWRRFISGALLLLLAIIPACAQPETADKVDNPQLAKSIYDQTVARLRRQDLLSPEENGFASLAPLCKSKDWDAKGKNLAPYRALSAYFMKEPEEHLQAFRSNPAQAARDVALFESIVPKLQQANSKKRFEYVFDWKTGGLNSGSPPHPVYPFLRVLAQGLRTAGLYYEFKGDPDKAAQRCLLGLELTNKWGKTGPLANRGVSAAYQGYNALPLLHLLGDAGFPATHYRHILKKTESFPATPADVLDGFDESYLAGIRFFDDLQSGKLSVQQLVDAYSAVSITLSDSQLQFLRKPGHFALEKTLFQNVYLSRRAYFEKLESVPNSLLKTQEAKLADKHCFLAQEQSPTPVCRVFKNSQTHLSAIRVMAALQAYHAEKKVYPAKLQDLLPGYLKQLPKNYMSPDGAFRYAQKGKSFKLESLSDVYPGLSLQKTMSYHPLSFKY